MHSILYYVHVGKGNEPKRRDFDQLLFMFLSVLKRNVQVLVDKDVCVFPDNVFA